MKRARLAGVAALALTASLGMTGAAHAAVGAPALATGLSSCPSSYLCFWNVQNYDGAMGKFSGDNADWSIFKTSNCSSGSWSNCAESAYNHGTNCTVYLFDYTSYQGLYHSLARGDRTPNMFGDYLNKVSSNRWCSPK